jgi:sulfoxide reductase heme-binding subunit YedZ
VHPWLLVGTGAALALVPLAATSATVMHRLLRPASWGRIHKLVYAAASLAVIHYAMARGLTRPEMAVDAVLVSAALLWRFVPRRARLSAAARPSSPA